MLNFTRSWHMWLATSSSCLLCINGYKLKKCIPEFFSTDNLEGLSAEPGQENAMLPIDSRWAIKCKLNSIIKHMICTFLVYVCPNYHIHILHVSKHSRVVQQVVVGFLNFKLLYILCLYLVNLATLPWKNYGIF